MSALESLRKLMAPPANPSDLPNEGGWQSVEHSLGIKLPEDYEEFVDCYGTGAVDNFLWVLNPFSQHANSSAGLTAAQRQQLEALGVEIVPMRGANHAEINIIERLHQGARVERWGISSGRHKRPLPCPECEGRVGRIGGTLEGN